MNSHTYCLLAVEQGLALDTTASRRLGGQTRGWDRFIAITADAIPFGLGPGLMGRDKALGALGIELLGTVYGVAQGHYLAGESIT